MPFATGSLKKLGRNTYRRVFLKIGFYIFIMNALFIKMRQLFIKKVPNQATQQYKCRKKKIYGFLTQYNRIILDGTKKKFEIYMKYFDYIKYIYFCVFYIWNFMIHFKQTLSEFQIINLKFYFSLLALEVVHLHV